MTARAKPKLALRPFLPAEAPLLDVSATTVPNNLTDKFIDDLPMIE